MAAHMSSSAPVSHSCYKDSLPRHTGVIVSRCLQSPVEGMCDTARWIYLDFPSLALDATGTSLLVRLPGRHLQVPEQGIYMYSAWRGGRADHGQTLVGPVAKLRIFALRMREGAKHSPIGFGGTWMASVVDLISKASVKPES